MIIRENPYLIIKINQKVYKFLTPEELKVETNWLKIEEQINIFNKETKKTNFAIPNIELTDNFTRTNYLGIDLFASGEKIYELYDSISEFSNIFFLGNSTISLGDIQLRNVYYKNNKFFLSDLGMQAGIKSNLYYDRSRFLVNLIDCNYKKQAKNILASEKQKKLILEEMDKRYYKVFF